MKDLAEVSEERLFAFSLDGKGGASPLDPWDEDAMKHALAQVKTSSASAAQTGVPARSGIWVHSDFKAAETQGWLQRVLGRRIAVQTSSWLTEDFTDMQPSFAVSPSSDALLMTLRAAKGLPTGLVKQGPKLVAFRMWLARPLLVSTRDSMPGDGVAIVSELAQQLIAGKGPATCGALAAAMMERTMQLSMVGAREAEDHVFALKERLQLLAMGALGHRELELLRRELAQIRYNVVMVRRYLLPHQEPLEAIMQFCLLPEGKYIFDEKGIASVKKAQGRHQALVERLDAARSAGEVLQGEILALIGWGTASASYRLTMLGCVLGMLGFFSVSFDLLKFMELRRLNSEKECKLPRSEAAAS